jgi:muramoyltetrapeptide carboxypeptidase
MNKARQLQKGDRVALVAPARAIHQSEIQDFLDLATREWGLEVQTEPELFNRDHQFAGDDPTRIAAFQKLIDDPGVKAIFCCRGGYGTTRILNSLDLTAFRKHPGWIIGYSDITALHALLNREGIESMHAMMPFSYTAGRPEVQSSAESLYKALFQEVGDYHFPAHTLNVEGYASGELIGGNLSVIYSLQATPWQYQPRNKILFLEDVDEYLYHIDRMMMNLQASGFLEGLSGLIVGYMTDMHDNETSFGMDAFHIISSAVKPYGYPVGFGLPAGHQDPNNALIIGRKVSLEVSTGRSTLRF